MLNVILPMTWTSSQMHNVHVVVTASLPTWSMWLVVHAMSSWLLVQVQSLQSELRAATPAPDLERRFREVCHAGHRCCMSWLLIIGMAHCDGATSVTAVCWLGPAVLSVWQCG